MRVVPINIPAFFYGIYKDSDNLDKEGNVNFRARPTIQLLVSSPAGVIGARFELILVSYTGSNYEDYYRRTKPFLGSSCILSVIQKFIESQKGAFLFYETHEFPDFDDEEVFQDQVQGGNGKDISGGISGSQLTLGQKLVGVT